MAVVSFGSSALSSANVRATSGGMAGTKSESDAATCFWPTASGGSTVPMFTARIGSSPLVSSQRPIQPLVTASTGLAVCQMSIDRKWLRSGFG
ncbi:hypothetical protein MAUB1S_04063 [Mycolicibacterium aubagnense]